MLAILIAGSIVVAMIAVGHIRPTWPVWRCALASVAVVGGTYLVVAGFMFTWTGEAVPRAAVHPAGFNIGAFGVASFSGLAAGLFD